jgi:hypothetical protein
MMRKPWFFQSGISSLSGPLERESFMVSLSIPPWAHRLRWCSRQESTLLLPRERKCFSILLFSAARLRRWAGFGGVFGHPTPVRSGVDLVYPFRHPAWPGPGDPVKADGTSHTGLMAPPKIQCRDRSTLSSRSPHSLFFKAAGSKPLTPREISLGAVSARLRERRLRPADPAVKAGRWGTGKGVLAAGQPMR